MRGRRWPCVECGFPAGEHDTGCVLRRAVRRDLGDKPVYGILLPEVKKEKIPDGPRFQIEPG